MQGQLTLVLGGARSGKSDFALGLAARTGGPVLFVATLEPLDEEMHIRIERHRRARPRSWRTLEASLTVVEALRAQARPAETVLLDCLTLWVNNLLQARLPSDPAPAEAEATQAHVLDAVDGLLRWQEGASVSLIVVSNEVGTGLVPPSPLGRLYRDVLGLANQRVAARAQKVYYLVAGLALELKTLGARPFDRSGPAFEAP